MNHLHGHPLQQDQEYIRIIREGGPPANRAIQQVYLRYCQPVYRYLDKLIYKNALYKGLPEDLLHDAFLALVRRVQFEGLEVQSLCAYWKGIGRRLMYNQLRKDERILLVNEDEEVYGLDEDSPESLFIGREREAYLASMFSMLGPRCREVLLLWIEKYSMPEIALKLNLSSGIMARKIKYECFKKLKDLLQNGNKMPGWRHKEGE